jgi:cytochrome bd-I ubiquinol oxidase subunit X
MWYFSWILGLALALALGVLNAMWFEIIESEQAAARRGSPPPAPGAAPPRR